MKEFAKSNDGTAMECIKEKTFTTSDIAMELGRTAVNVGFKRPSSDALIKLVELAKESIESYEYEVDEEEKSRIKDKLEYMLKAMGIYAFGIDTARLCSKKAKLGEPYVQKLNDTRLVTLLEQCLKGHHAAFKADESWRQETILPLASFIGNECGSYSNEKEFLLRFFDEANFVADFISVFLYDLQGKPIPPVRDVFMTEAEAVNQWLLSRKNY